MNPRSRFSLLLLFLVATLPALAQDAKPDPLAPIEDVSGLPRALIIGDSISIGYTLPVRAMLAGEFNVHRIPQNGANTQVGLDNIDTWLGDGKWDVIHFNWGLHDVKRLDAEGKMDASKSKAIALPDYEKNLRALVQRMKKTGAKLIWANTTPVPVGAAGRRPGDAAAYNRVAMRIMAEEGVRINDLFGYISPDVGVYQKKADVHFTNPGSERLGKRVAEFILSSYTDMPLAGDFMFDPHLGGDYRVTKETWAFGPHNRWGLQHVREITSTATVSRGDGPVRAFESKPKPVLDLKVKRPDGEMVTVKRWLHDSYTDGFLILYKDKVATEVYMNDMEPESLHNLFSMSKSYLGVLCGMLIERGILNPDAPITDYVPELEGSVYGDALVRHLLDMNVGIAFDEDYANPDSDIFRHAFATNALGDAGDLTLRKVLTTFKKEGEHGQGFHYVTANTDALGWVAERAAGRSLIEMLSTEIWSKIGAEQDAAIIVDLDRTTFIGGGFNTTLRDSARFGQMMLHRGKVGETQVVPESFIKDIETFSIPTRNKGTRYRSQWWVESQYEAIAASGVAGQDIIVVPNKELVIVKFSSWPTLDDYGEDSDRYDQSAYEAILTYFDGVIDDD